MKHGKVKQACRQVHASIKLRSQHRKLYKSSKSSLFEAKLLERSSAESSMQSLKPPKVHAFIQIKHKARLTLTKFPSGPGACAKQICRLVQNQVC